jgi:catechol 2,3-dioxygenase-like lactoylglutathione lyase family enzyme
MEASSQIRFSGVMDHVAVPVQDLQRDVAEYERLGFRLETLYEDWAMLRDAKGFGVALLPPGSKHPPHLGLRVETREELEAAAQSEGRPVKEHRDKTLSFYTKGVSGQIVELIYYPPEYTGGQY